MILILLTEKIQRLYYTSFLDLCLVMELTHVHSQSLQYMSPTSNNQVSKSQRTILEKLGRSTLRAQEIQPYHFLSYQSYLTTQIILFPSPFTPNYFRENKLRQKFRGMFLNSFGDIHHMFLDKYGIMYQHTDQKVKGLRLAIFLQ